MRSARGSKLTQAASQVASNDVDHECRQLRISHLQMLMLVNLEIRLDLSELS